MGIGLCGFVDGILLHQILQWHHMLTATSDYPRNTVAGLEANTLADGFFHLSTWLFVAVAMTLTVAAWRAGDLAPPWRAHVGLLLAGWGAFNLVEGVIDLEILGIPCSRRSRWADRLGSRVPRLRRPSAHRRPDALPLRRPGRAGLTRSGGSSQEAAHPDDSAAPRIERLIGGRTSGTAGNQD